MSIVDRMRADVAALATPAGRMVGTSSHERAREWLVAAAVDAGLAPYADGLFEWPYVGQGDALCNVIARAPGRSRIPRRPLLLAAHYDTCGVQPGADDNAAAVAIALACARRLVATPADCDVIFAWFDGEEPPHFLSPSMGSVYWYHHQRREETRAAVVLDLVGHAVPIPGRGELLFATGAESDPALPEILAACPTDGLRLMPVLNRYVGDMSDHHVFRVQRRPYVFLSCGQWQHYHQPSDLPEVLDYPKMGRIAGFVEALLRALSASALPGPFESRDTLPFELDAARLHLGELALHLSNPLRDRRDLDRLVETARAMFGLVH